ncbi:hypothetical protein Bsp3421_001443 [Burkholderia sp. FERM BP-3421]|uniref:hypothetical protein n=1 Tax=Burkholderia sp. FERM BP-3421 TaxID=1494466 RepID=UPI00235F9A36|nr:hypothetical protein [Burkholderia sp. FERM BP-3421]WDD91516.1 hypothetical protein Bsp3421_001443 [Burkholderia sp. FERM BP-3421]
MARRAPFARRPTAERANRHGAGAPRPTHPAPATPADLDLGLAPGLEAAHRRTTRNRQTGQALATPRKIRTASIATVHDRPASTRQSGATLVIKLIQVVLVLLHADFQYSNQIAHRHINMHESIMN